ncbi:hypothetical protein FOVSG1_015006 [Fusarium oxysporum f. sp. vasinfectum]
MAGAGQTVAMFNGTSEISSVINDKSLHLKSEGFPITTEDADLSGLQNDCGSSSIVVLQKDHDSFFSIPPTDELIGGKLMNHFNVLNPVTDAREFAQWHN